MHRQTESAKAYADKHGYIFDEQLKDEGVSGFRGANRKTGKLGRFLDSVKAGKVPAGSVLFVEDLDRLSREEMVDAFEMVVYGLIKQGITIATPSGEYDRESLNGSGIWRLIGKLQTAHEESSKKSERLGRAWSHKKHLARQNGLVATSRVPHWLKVVNGKCEVIPAAAETVKMIFALAPTLGRSRLIKKLNTSAPWMPPGNKLNGTGNGWRMSYVRKILSNRAVLGEYQPFTKRDGKRVPDGEVILDYFPQVIEPEVFHSMQLSVLQNRGKGGRTGSAWNLFSNLAKCAYCGGSMAFRDRGALPKGGRYLVCDNGQRGFKCERRSVRYSEVQDLVLSNCRLLRPEQVLSDDSERTRICEALRIRIAGAEKEITDNEDKTQKLLDQIEVGPTPAIRMMYEQRIHAAGERNELLRHELELDRATLQTEQQSQESFQNWQNSINELLTAIAPREAVEARLRLTSHLKDLISKIEIFAHGFQTQFDADLHTRSEHIEHSEALAEQVSELVIDGDRAFALSREFRDFLADLTVRRMSSEGRFYRVHFKSGRYLDLVPAGSLASGWHLVDRANNRWTSVAPDTSELWLQFTAAHNLKSRVRRQSEKPCTT